jgi:hypothetical protein
MREARKAEGPAPGAAVEERQEKVARSWRGDSVRHRASMAVAGRVGKAFFALHDFRLARAGFDPLRAWLEKSVQRQASNRQPTSREAATAAAIIAGIQISKIGSFARQGPGPE